MPGVGDFQLGETLNSGQVFHWTESEGGFVGAAGDSGVRLAQRGARLTMAGADRRNLERYLGLDHDLEAIRGSFRSAGEDPALHAAISYAPGLRIMRQPAWECLATFITSSMKKVAHIRAISLDLRRRFGTELSIPSDRGDGAESVWSYPGPETVAGLSEEELRGCGMGYRAVGFLKTAERIASDPARFASIADLEDAELDAALKEFHGVGPKISACVMLFAYGRMAAFPVDVWVERLIRRLYFPRRRKAMRPAEIVRFAARQFGPHAGYAQQYLFHHARVGGSLEGA